MQLDSAQKHRMLGTAVVPLQCPGKCTKKFALKCRACCVSQSDFTTMDKLCCAADYLRVSQVDNDVWDTIHLSLGNLLRCKSIFDYNGNDSYSRY